MTGKAKPTVTEAERAARMVKMIFRQAAKRVPGLKASHSTTSKRIRGHRTVPKAFIRSMISVVDDLEVLQRMSGFDPEEAQAALQFEAAFRSVVDQMAVLQTNLTYTIEAQIAVVAGKALRAYAIIKGLARDGRNRDLAIRIRRLKTALGRKGPRKKKKPRTPA